MPVASITNAEPPAVLGRFKVARVLGQGAQSTVYVAVDPQLQRQVALKAMRLQGGGDAAAAMLHEARAVSRLSHPAIVPVFEVGEHDGQPYLVFEYVPGQTLADRIRTAGAMAPEKAIGLILPVLEAVAFAHAQGVIHRDLKPSNILIDVHGSARVMDFGIAVRQALDADTLGFSPSLSPSAAGAAEDSDLNELIGTPAYMAPEYAQRGIVSVQMDVFSAGLILYEMLVGRRAVPEENGMQALAHIIQGEFRLPPDTPYPVDERLRAVVNRAMQSDRHLRHGTMQELVDGLNHWLTAPAAPPGQVVVQDDRARDGTALEFLMRRMRLKSDFPSLSESISRINRLATSDRQNIMALARAIHGDMAMSQRMLRTVNSALYKGLGGGVVTTLSRAIMLLGFDAVRRLATSQMIFENHKDHTQAGRLLDEYLTSHYMGVLGRELSGLPDREAEEAALCASFHHYGRLLAQHYFPDEVSEIQRLSRGLPDREPTAAFQVLGLSLDKLGAGVARSWGLPDPLIRGMHVYGPQDVIPVPYTRADLLQAVAAMSGELAQAARYEQMQEQQRALSVVVQRYGKALGLNQATVKQAMEQAHHELKDLVGVLHMDLSHAQVGRRLASGVLVLDPQIRVSPSPSPASASPAPAAPGVPMPGRVLPVMAKEAVRGQASGAPSAPPPTPAPPAEASVPTEARASSFAPLVGEAWAVSQAQSRLRQDLLSTGIDAVTRALVGQYSQAEVLKGVLDTMLRAMAFDHVVLCLRDNRSQALTARLALAREGRPQAGVAKLQVPLTERHDLFAAAALKGVDLLIADVNSPSVASRIPAWYSKTVAAHTFLLLPMQMQGQVMGLLYADRKDAGSIIMSEKELALLRTLRNQTMLVLRQPAAG